MAPAVRDEIEQGVEFGHEYLISAVEAFDDGLILSDVPPEMERISLRERLDRGETEALRGAVERAGRSRTAAFVTKKRRRSESSGSGRSRMR